MQCGKKNNAKKFSSSWCNHQGCFNKLNLCWWRLRERKTGILSLAILFHHICNSTKQLEWKKKKMKFFYFKYFFFIFMCYFLFLRKRKLPSSKVLKVILWVYSFSDNICSKSCWMCVFSQLRFFTPQTNKNWEMHSIRYSLGGLQILMFNFWQLHYMFETVLMLPQFMRSLILIF